MCVNMYRYDIKCDNKMTFTENGYVRTDAYILASFIKKQRFTKLLSPLTRI